MNSFDQNQIHSQTQTPNKNNFLPFSPDNFSQSPFGDFINQTPAQTPLQMLDQQCRDYSQLSQSNLVSPNPFGLQFLDTQLSQSQSNKQTQFLNSQEIKCNDDPQLSQTQDQSQEENVQVKTEQDITIEKFNPDKMSPGKKLFKLNSFYLQVEVTNTPPPHLISEQQRQIMFREQISSQRKLNFNTSPQQQFSRNEDTPSISVDNKYAISRLFDEQKQTETHKNQFPQQQFVQSQQYQPVMTSQQQSSQFCKCLNSKCLQRYCVCFGKNQYCNQFCKCRDCSNTYMFQHTREEAIQKAQNKNPNAFVSFAQKQTQNIKGCNCKKTKCTKGYCDCYQAGIPCTELCKCTICQNKVPLKKQKVEGFYKDQQGFVQPERGTFFNF